MRCARGIPTKDTHYVPFQWAYHEATTSVAIIPNYNTPRIEIVNHILGSWRPTNMSAVNHHS
eukprot:scaffold202552_cov19-Prasinocladus_malaysianus.AAC.1